MVIYLPPPVACSFSMARHGQGEDFLGRLNDGGVENRTVRTVVGRKDPASSLCYLATFSKS